jgi:glycosyltransferase involved in cell wall biosynthesis
MSIIPQAASSPLRVLVASHSHPELSSGGAEISAFQLYRDLSGHRDAEAWFLGCDRNRAYERMGAPIVQPFSDSEFLYSPGEFHWLNFANRDPRFPEAFVGLLNHLAPDVVHFHHYAVFGVEAFAHVKHAVPGAKIVLTLHEYLAICHHFGQMVTKGKYALCHSATPIRCNQCFPEIDKSDFFLRKQYIARFFDLVDHFISPSSFLAERYVAWGIPEHKISVIENILSPRTLKERRPTSPDSPLRIGFFGQLSELKGINVLFDAAKLLEDQEFHDVSFDIFGDYRSQPPEFQKEFLERLAKTGRNVYFRGPYDQSQVDDLMKSVDAVLIPSIWWENSPVVIQEALRASMPVICSDIGGMAEKVRDGIDGFHFPVGHSMALAALLKRLAGDRQALNRIARTMQRPATAEQTTEAHLVLYRRLGAAGNAISGR